MVFTESAQAIVVPILEAFVVYYHVSFVSQYTLDNVGIGISEADLIYHAIFILALFFQVFLAADALWRRNSVQIIGLVVFNFLSLAYAGIQLYQHQILEDQGTANADYNPKDLRFPKYDKDAPKIYYEGKMRPIEHSIIGLMAGFSVYLAIISYLLSKEFGWENYKTYSADIKVRDAYMNLTILQTLIKLDTFFIGSYALQLIPSKNIGYATEVLSLIEVVLVFVFGTAMLVMAWFSVVKEMKYLLLSVINIYTLSLIYWVWRVIAVNIIPNNQSSDPYLFTRRFLTFFLTTIIAFVIITIIYCIICFRNMKRGTYVLTVFGKSEKELESKNLDYLDPSSPRSKRQSAIHQQRLRAQERESRIILD
ncbi:hypothetical protein C2G38_2047456 [Gigaspora rosea]|uniref:Uncharacterized protein n=1 Tax=Gigaspora rosea TaxID=44941 RepID=A0A397UA67_9GLOM|nr:hypothetical protein C2G38_2047456 [Gigaspora rosea]